MRAPLALAFAAACLALFAALAADQHWNGPFTQADAALGGWLHRHAQPSVTALALAVSHLHSTVAICLAALATGTALAWYRQLAWLPLLAACVPGGLMLNFLVKHAFQRARPAFDAQAAALASYSFPSGHTAGATVWWGFALALWFAWEKRLPRRAAACALAAAMVLLTALSRMYLGLHYLGDVLAAIAEGVAWVMLCMAATQWAAAARPAAGPVP